MLDRKKPGYDPAQRINRLLDPFAGFLAPGGGIIHRASPVRFNHTGGTVPRGHSLANGQNLDKLFERQIADGFFVRHIILWDGRPARLVVQGNVQRLEILNPDNTVITLQPPPPILFEHGWLRETPEYTYEVYVPDWLASYYAGSGTEIPDSAPVRYEHFVNKLTKDPYTGLPSFPGPVPTLDGNKQHASLVSGRSQLADDPSLHAGLTRLAVQAWNGSGRSISQVLGGAGMAGGPGELIVTRDPDGNYWSWKVRSTGISAIKLVPHEFCVPLSAWCESGAVSGQARELADAWVLGTASPEKDENGEFVVHSVLSAGAMSGIYADSCYPYRWGFCGRYQRRGAPDEHQGGCACVALRVYEEDDPNGWRFRSRQVEIDLSVNGGVPSASLSIGASVTWSIAGTGCRWIEVDRQYACWVHIPPLSNAPTYYGVGAPMAAWYRPDGALDVAEWEPPQENSAESHPDPRYSDYKVFGEGSTTVYTVRSITAGLTTGFSTMDVDGVRRISSGFWYKTDTLSVAAGDSQSFTMSCPGHTNDSGGMIDFYSLDWTTNATHTSHYRSTRSCGQSIVFGPIPGLVYIFDGAYAGDTAVNNRDVMSRSRPTQVDTVTGWVHKRSDNCPNVDQVRSLADARFTAAVTENEITYLPGEWEGEPGNPAKVTAVWPGGTKVLAKEDAKELRLAWTTMDRYNPCRSDNRTYIQSYASLIEIPKNEDLDGLWPRYPGIFIGGV